jgi:hypothetical protein
MVRKPKEPKRKHRKKAVPEPEKQPHIHILKRTIRISKWHVVGSIAFIGISYLLLLLILQPSTTLPKYMTINKSYPIEEINVPENNTVQGISFPSLSEKIFPSWLLIFIGGQIFIFAIVRPRERLMVSILSIILFGLIFLYTNNMLFGGGG